MSQSKTNKEIIKPFLNAGEAWTDEFLELLNKKDEQKQTQWQALLEFIRDSKIKSAKPNEKWVKEAQLLLDNLGHDEFRKMLLNTLPLISRKRTQAFVPDYYEFGSYNDEWHIGSKNTLMLRGLLWMLPLVANDDCTRLLAPVIKATLKKLAGIGPRNIKIANACVYALSQIETQTAVATLARLSTTVTFKGTLNQINKYLQEIANKLGIESTQLLDMSVPDFSLTLDNYHSKRELSVADYTVQLMVNEKGAKLNFFNGDKVLKSAPATIKKDFAETLKSLKADVKEINALQTSVAHRLDNRMISLQTWDSTTWLEYYFYHPLTASVARRLIWLIDGVSVFWYQGALRTLSGDEVAVPDNARIRLWHPIGCEVDEVLAWRDLLDNLQIQQPFKQAWREVYLLTDAERETSVYSNRFAGHILKQHQFNQLAKIRGWDNRLRLMVDDTYPPASRSLAEYQLRAEYWIEGVGDDYHTDATASGSYLRVVTDQLRFYGIQAPENHAHASGGGYEMYAQSGDQDLVNPIELEKIPALVLSEIMRDVDLFVGVASIGNDPTWQDGGVEGRYRTYWQNYGFGDLTETAKTRGEYLKRLIPRLKIADRLSLDDKFLLVRGDKRSYKIHLGSSNILMMPNDQYLCIIAKGNANGSPDINFDGDGMLSIILSKAFLLANDTKIKDPVILNQINQINEK